MPGIDTSRTTTSDRLSAISRFADDCKILLLLKQEAEAAPHNGVIVGQHDSNHM
jgi:hypothetical protein